MSGSNRGFVATIIGCLIGAAIVFVFLQPGKPILPGYEQPQQQNPAYRPGGPGCDPVRLYTRPERETADERSRCEEAAEEHRLKSDDLIQQTRAADAARENVFLSYTQTIYILAATVIGFLTLIAALFAAWYARSAATSGRATLDAYVAIEGAKLVVSAPGAGRLAKRASVDIDVTNIGRSSAIVHGIYWAWMDSNTYKGDGMFSGPPRHEHVPSDTSHNLGYIRQEPFLKNYLGGYVSYVSPARAEHRSYFCFEISPAEESKLALKVSDAITSGWPANT